jgi:glycosyltransferase involved in cell wall biosynthesis
LTTDVHSVNTIDVICPVYNHEKYIRECLESIFAQEDVHVLVHVFNDASTDSSLKIIEEFQEKYENQLRIYSNAKNYGNAVRSITANNFQLSSDFWTYIEGDDYLVNKRKFISQIMFLKRNKNLIASATQCMLRDVKLGRNQIMRPDLQNWNFYDLVTKKKMYSMYTHISSIVWKRKSGIRRRNPWQTNLFRNAISDSEVFFVHLMLKKSRKSIAFQDIPGSCYRYTGEGIWSSLNQFEQSELNQKLQLDIDSITPIWIKMKRKKY